MASLSESTVRELTVAIQWGIKIPLRDEVRLNATVYRPKEARTRKPVVLTMTPYCSDALHTRGTYFASNGLPFVCVDVRGRGDSEGTFRPFIQEAQDGHDVIEWLARQEYCDGQVAMCGGSYNGYAQWAAAKEFPCHLKTIMPTAAPHLGTDFPMRNNISYPFLIRWLTLVRGRTTQQLAFDDNAYWSERFYEWYQSGSAFRDLDTTTGAPSAVFQDWMQHPAIDAYWDAYNPTADQYTNISIPVLTITGCYDDDQVGALEHYRAHLRSASPESARRHFLVIGPWDHAGTRDPTLLMGGLELGPASLVDLKGLQREWCAWTLEAGPKPTFLTEPVMYYVTAREQWQGADSLEAVTSGYLNLYLDSDGHANSASAPGSLHSSPGTGSPDQYVYDPRRVDCGYALNEKRVGPSSWVVDQSLLIALQGQALIYHSVPLSESLLVAGFFKLSIWVAIDTPDTDLYASLYEILPDGSSVRLSTDALRARYRQSLRRAELISTRAPLRYDFERFTFVARELAKGSRLRLAITPIGRLIDAAFAQRNFNGGGAVSEEGVRTARPVTVSLFHGARHPSVLRVPRGAEDLTRI